MGKLKYVIIPVAAFVVAYVVERTGYRRYGPDNPDVPADEVSWGSVFLVWVVATSLFFLTEGVRNRRKRVGRTGEDR